MEKRIPTFEDFINESISAKDAAKALGVNDPADKEVSLWVTVANMLEEYDFEILQALTDGKFITGINKNTAVGVYIEENGGKKTLIIKKAVTEDAAAFVAKAMKTTPEKWESLNAACTIEKIDMGNSIKVRDTADSLEKILKRIHFSIK